MLRFMGGLPRALPLAETPMLLQADETALAPWRRPKGLLLGLTADRGSAGSIQKEPLVVGVIAECG